MIFFTLETSFEVWAIFHFSAIYPTFWLLFSNFFLFFNFQAQFSILWICLAIKSIFSKSWWHLHFVWFFIQKHNLQYLSFFSTMHMKSHFRVECKFFWRPFQHQNLLLELDSFYFFNDCFIFSQFLFHFLTLFPNFFCISQHLKLFELMNFSTLKTCL